MPERTDWPLALDAIAERAERADAWIAQVITVPNATPAIIHMHFETDMPALLDRVRRLQPVMHAAVRYVAAKRAVDQAQGEPYAPLMHAMTAAEAVFDTAVLAALEGEPA